MFDEFSAYNRNNIGYGDVVTYKIADEEEQGSDINEERAALPDEEYSKPITTEDVKVLRSIGRKSINKFTSEDIKKHKNGHINITKK